MIELTKEKLARKKWRTEHFYKIEASILAVIIVFIIVIILATAPANPEQGTMVFYHYTVTSGDTLTDIAIKYYGEPIDYNIQDKIHEIETVNDKTNSNLKVGEIVIVPVFRKADE
jgi:hypothetical protein